MPSTLPGIEPETLGIEGQRYTNSPTRSTIRSLGRPRGKWEDNIKMYLREVGYDDRDWINLAQDRDRWRAYVRAVNEPPGSLKSISYLASELYEDDNAGEMSPGSSTESYPAFAHIGLRENPGKSLNQVETSVNNTRGEIATGIASKVKKVLDRNAEYKTLCQISDTLCAKNYSMDGIQNDLTADDIPLFKYAPITSIDVEHSFSSNNIRALMMKNVVLRLGHPLGRSDSVHSYGRMT
ncbi:hypothetical protein ANN_11420 [Periplaneta americana]|uniref:Uncharacterized protein n=1 Tax=Periplaneta americana TaxID=6978 RepID=A0ABQ8T4Y7_PERAM|nr:hypothetical protein ANN_11420 [Periplaneta americana]